MANRFALTPFKVDDVVKVKGESQLHQITSVIQHNGMVGYATKYLATAPDGKKILMTTSWVPHGHVSKQRRASRRNRRRRTTRKRSTRRH
jgi:hypothetical protein